MINGALRFTIVLLLCILASASGLAQQSSSMSSGNGPAGLLPNLAGPWIARGYTDPNPVPYEIITINQKGNSIVATKAQGDNYIHSGEVTWQGNFTGESSFPVQVQCSPSPQSKDRFVSQEEATIISSDEIHVSGSAIPTLSFIRAGTVSIYGGGLMGAHRAIVIFDSKGMFTFGFGPVEDLLFHKDGWLPLAYGRVDQGNQGYAKITGGHSIRSVILPDMDAQQIVQDLKEKAKTPDWYVIFHHDCWDYAYESFPVSDSNFLKSEFNYFKPITGDSQSVY